MIAIVCKIRLDFFKKLIKLFNRSLLDLDLRTRLLFSLFKFFHHTIKMSRIVLVSLFNFMFEGCDLFVGDLIVDLELGKQLSFFHDI